MRRRRSTPTPSSPPPPRWPTCWKRQAALDAAQRRSLGKIGLLLSAGAPIPEPLLARVQGIVPAARIHTPYGMTEALPVTDIDLDGIRAAGAGNGVCVGTPVAGAQVAIAALAARRQRLGPAATTACRDHRGDPGARPARQGALRQAVDHPARQLLDPRLAPHRRRGTPR